MILSDNTVFGILAHVDAGKTTLTESMLFNSGAIRRLGRVDKRDSWFDYNETERRRGITIYSKQNPFIWKNKKFTLIDTPGHVDFSAEMERTLGILDMAVLVIDGTSGIQAHTETIRTLLEEYRIPTIVFINKTDRETFSKEAVMLQLKEKLSENCLDFTEGIPFEDAAMLNEKTMDAFLEENFDCGFWKNEIAKAVKERKAFPCVFGSALQGNGVDRLLDLLSDYSAQKEYPDNFSADVYKILHTDKGERLTFLKVTGGKLAVKMSVDNEKIDTVNIFSGEKSEVAKEVAAGNVCAVTGLSETYPGQKLGENQCRGAKPVLNPMLSAQVILTDSTDLHTAVKNLRILSEELPELSVKTKNFGNEEQIQIQVMGRIQLEVLKEIAEKRFGMSIDFGPCRILYKETVAAPVMGYGHYEPLRHYAETQLRLEPAERGRGITARSECSLEVLDANFQHLVLSHILEKEHIGILTGSPLTDVDIVLTAGRSHLKHTEGGDFREATYRAIRQALEKAENILLEPYYSFTLRVPSDEVGRALSDIQKMAGEFEPPEIKLSEAIIKGFGPVSEFIGYPEELTAYTKGKGSISFRDAGYRPCHNSAEVIEKIGYEKERDLENPSSSVFCSHGAGFEVKWYDDDAMRHIK